jgi:hypothetical protein
VIGVSVSVSRSFANVQVIKRWCAMEAVIATRVVEELMLDETYK